MPKASRRACSSTLLEPLLIAWDVTVAADDDEILGWICHRGSAFVAWLFVKPGLTGQHGVARALPARWHWHGRLGALAQRSCLIKLLQALARDKGYLVRFRPFPAPGAGRRPSESAPEQGARPRLGQPRYRTDEAIAAFHAAKHRGPAPHPARRPHDLGAIALLMCSGGARAKASQASAPCCLTALVTAERVLPVPVAHGGPGGAAVQRMPGALYASTASRSS